MSTSDKDLQDFMIGLCLAIASSIFIGASFILKKLGLLRYARKEAMRAGQGGYGYLKEWMWWTGMILMTSGECANFAAYAFAPATLVTPLGALSVIVSAVLSARILKEKLNILGKVGCVLCVLGSTMMVIHSPKEQEIHSVYDLMMKMKEPAFIVFGAILLIVAIVSIVYFAPKYGQKNVLVYVTICSSLGCFTVMGCKGVGTAINATIRGNNEFTNWMTYFLIGVIVVCILLQLNYLNRALDTFNTAVVTPIYYVFFTSFVITGSAILFQEFEKMPALDIVGDLCGFLVIVVGIFLLNAFKDMKISWKNLPKAAKEPEIPETDSVSNTGVTNATFADIREIEARISRNMSADCITRTISEESDSNENEYSTDKHNGSSPIHEI
ncbi:magnesium transporter NIPA2-like isoform X3 [Biomphalaria pfeifferi]|uniref:Magnesium transporter NIPA2-like isoform X3 n=1 Tax=Biomphalaria pfeifferi TaxID=112525 RepID=A0AAD8C2L2_BIOPF|nr:magnesium transporter NIPA2-like isoform X3 [Biomphalaria pfeifferi]